MTAYSGADYNELERKQAKEDGAKLVKNSGRGEKKGDGILGNFMVDYKFTEAGSFSISVKAWNKHKLDALAEGKYPCVVPIFLAHEEKLGIVDWAWVRDWILMDEENEKLRDELGELREEYRALGDSYDEMAWRMDGLEK